MMCVGRGYEYISTSTQRSQKRLLGPLELELQAEMSLIWRRCRKLDSSGPLWDRYVIFTAELSLQPPN